MRQGRSFLEIFLELGNQDCVCSVAAHSSNIQVKASLTKNTAQSVETNCTALTMRAEIKLEELPEPKMPMPANIWGAKKEICTEVWQDQ